MDTKARTVYVIGSGQNPAPTPMATVNNIAERDALSNTLFAMVLDATGDTTVTQGWALYAATPSGWTKIAEEETVEGLFGFKREIAKTLVEKKKFVDTVAELKRMIGQAGGSVTPLDKDTPEVDPNDYGDRDIINAINTLIQWAKNAGKKKDK